MTYADPIDAVVLSTTGDLPCYPSPHVSDWQQRTCVKCGKSCGSTVFWRLAEHWRQDSLGNGYKVYGPDMLAYCNRCAYEYPDVALPDGVYRVVNGKLFGPYAQEV